MIRTRSLALILAALSLACTAADDGAGDTLAAGDTATPAPAAAPSGPRPVATIQGAFKTPESVRYDADQDVWFVSNINGVPSDKDNNGFISRVNAETGQVDSLMFVAGGRGGVTLHAPKGMALVGDTLWVADVDAVRGFHRRTGAALATINVQGATFLNDIVAAADGSLYVTDTGIRITATGMEDAKTDRVFRIQRRSASVVAEGEVLGKPNGIAWDAANQRFLIASFGKNTILGWKPGQTSPETVATGAGQFDGLEVLADGRILASSWADSTITAFAAPAGGGTMTGTKIVTGVASPADIGIDTKRSRVAVPLFEGNRVEVYQLQ